MKKTYFFPLALTTLMLGACSSEDGLNLGGGGSVAPGKKGYVSFAIKMPTQQGTAVRANDVFDDGVEAEYNVKDAVLITFAGTSEATATFNGAYQFDLGAAEKVGSSTDNITTTYKLAQEITKPATEGQNVYALVVLNGVESKIISVDASNASCTIKGATLTQGTTKVADLENVKYQLTNKDVDNIANLEPYGEAGKNGCFLMTNAPLFSKAGGVSDPTGGVVSTLTEIRPERVYTTADEAKANPAANVYVERAVAKVTVTGSTTNTPVTDAGALASYQIQGWDLDVTNNAGYLVRKTNDAWWTLKYEDQYRFVGGVAVATDLYRTYWGIDPNYDGTIDLATNFTTKANGVLTQMRSLDDPGYCLENTFTLANMNEDQTTRVIVGATLSVKGAEGDKDFYTINDNKNSILTLESVTNAVKHVYLTNEAVVDTLHKYLAATPGNSLTGDDLTVTYDQKSVTGGYMAVTEVSIKSSAASKFKNNVIPVSLTDNTNSAIIDYINAHNKIGYYKGGLSFYPVKIRHFQDGEVKNWDGTLTAYDKDENFLGRWGVLRNNWYNIAITGIKTIGSPEVPEVYPTPDDPTESWISVEINVLSWAKRTQSAVL